MPHQLIKNLNKTLKTQDKYIKLYKQFKNKNLKTVFSSIQAELMDLFELMNEKLPTKNFYSYYPAKESRELLFLIETIENLEKNLENTEFSFELDGYYIQIFETLKKTLKSKSGSTIERNMNKIEIYQNEPIFIKK